MALRKPLVIISGIRQEIPSGDTLDAVVAEVDVISLTNGNAGAIVCGTPVYISAVDTYDLARANAFGTTKVIGLQKDTSVAAGATGIIQTDGIIALSTAQWDAVAGTTGGLTFNVLYYLDAATAGLLTATPPSGAGKYIYPIGLALSTTEMRVSVNPGAITLLA